MTFLISFLCFLSYETSSRDCLKFIERSERYVKSLPAIQLSAGAETMKCFSAPLSRCRVKFYSTLRMWPVHARHDISNLVCAVSHSYETSSRDSRIFLERSERNFWPVPAIQLSTGAEPMKCDLLWLPRDAGSNFIQLFECDSCMPGMTFQI